jgi:Holliday junction DNA helicase RuvA
VKGIGKKTAERIVLELRDKVTEFVTEVRATSRVTGQGGHGQVFEDAMDALQALGFPRRDAERAVREIATRSPAMSDSGEVVKEALRYF